MSATALLVIDVQVAMFEEPEGPIFDPDGTLRNITRLLERARSSDAEVIFVQHCEDDSPFEPGTRQFDLHPDLKRTEDEAVVYKHTPDSFHETNLKEILDGRAIGRLVVCGMQTEVCVNATCRKASELGYDVTVASDAHGTFDEPDLPAASIIARQNQDLADGIATVTKTEEIDFQRMKGNP